MPQASYHSAAIDFEQLPYRSGSFTMRNWGNPLHSLCSYQGKLKPAIAHLLVNNFTEPHDVVLDPLSGAGTIPLEAMLSGRTALANDIQELGFILSSAKVSSPNHDVLARELEDFLRFVRVEKSNVTAEQLATADFGLNGSIRDYFHPENLLEVLAARRYISERQCDSAERAIVLSSFLHILHGNRPYALSRTSHPVTPFKPSGPFDYRNFDSRVIAKVARAAGTYPLFGNYSPQGHATLGSFENLPYVNEIDAVITSPPFAASTRFYSANWMRLWAVGWTPESFSGRKANFIEEKQRRGFDIYSVFFEAAAKWLKPGGKLILHLGKTAKIDMAEELTALVPPSFTLVHKFDENVSAVKSFGISDQGATSTHQFMFLSRNLFG